MRAYVLYAQQHLDGCVPLSAITHSRLLRGWFKEHQPEVSQDHAAMMKAIRQQISKEGSSDGSTQGGGPKHCYPWHTLLTTVRGVCSLFISRHH